MKTKKNTINTTAKIVIPGNEGISETTQGSKEDILNNLKSISNEDIKDVSEDIECGKLIREMENGKAGHFSLEDADLLISNGYPKIVGKNIGNFEPSLHKAIALKIINKVSEDGRTFYWNCLKNFSGLDSEVALAMIKGGFANVFYDISHTCFHGVSKEVAFALFEAGYTDDLSVFNKNERKEIALFYLENGKVDLSLSSVDCDKKFADDIIKLKKDYGFNIICKNIENFPSEDHKGIALNIIKNGGVEIFLQRIERFYGMDKDVALALAENGDITPNLSLFSGDDRQDIAFYLIEHGYKPSLQEVPRLNITFANKLIEKKEFEYLLNNIQYFYDRDHKEIALAILKAGYILSHENLRKIKNKNKDFALALFQHVNNHEWDSEDPKMKEKFENYTAEYIGEYIADNPGEFADLDDEIAGMLIDLGYGSKVKKHKKFYKDLSTYTKMRLLMK